MRDKIIEIVSQPKSAEEIADEIIELMEYEYRHTIISQREQIKGLQANAQDLR